MKKILFIILVLGIGLWSCSDNDEIGNSPDDYTDVIIKNGSKGLKSVVGPGGATSWNMDDEVKILDVGGIAQTFTNTGETQTSTAEFKGKLRAKQGTQLYKAYYAPKNCQVTLKDGHTLSIERKELNIEEGGVEYNSELIGTYCPMVSLPTKFDAEIEEDNKSFQFYHVTTMIEGRVTLRRVADAVYRDKMMDFITFEIKATDSTPFNQKVEFDLNQLTESSIIEDFDTYIVPVNDPTAKTDTMATTFKFTTARTIGTLIDQYNASVGNYFPIPIFALPTEESFDYTAIIRFYYEGQLQLEMKGSATAEELNPFGLSILNFDHNKIVNRTY